jgi:tellurite resistance protein TerB
MPKSSTSPLARSRRDDLRADLLSAMIEYRGADLMEATIAACAIIAHADGNVAPSERAQMLQLMRADPLLAMFPRDAVMEEFARHARAYDLNYGDAVREAIVPVMKLAGRKRHARVVLNACLLITAADGRVDPREVDAIRLVRDALNVEPDPGGVAARPVALTAAA